MIEQFFAEILKELGVSGILVFGLYFLLYRPLRAMAETLKTINEELREIITILKAGKG